MNIFEEYGNNVEEGLRQAAIEDRTEELAKETLEREKLLEEAFNGYFSRYFPKYLQMQGPWVALRMMKKEDVLEFIHDDLAKEFDSLESARKSLEAEREAFEEERVALQESSKIFQNGMIAIAAFADIPSLSADELRRMIKEEIESCMLEESGEDYFGQDDHDFLMEEQNMIFEDSAL